ncbi:MAG: AMP-binding protein [Pseudomonadota bacterium]
MAEITRAETWEAVRAAHRWDIPGDFSMAWTCCDRWAETEPDRLALIHVADPVREYTFSDLKRLSSQLANVLVTHGIGRGDRVGCLLPQVPETVLAHLACYRIGAILMPLFTLFGEDALSYRLSDSGAKAVITDAANLPKVDAIRADLPDLEFVWSVDGRGDGAASMPEAMAAVSDQCARVALTPEDPAFLCYTSGTTGPPKGALLPHRVVLGHVPATQIVQDFYPQPGDRIWTPSDWAWLGGLGNILLPALYLGMPVVAHRAEKFDPEEAFALMQTHRVTNAFLAPTALKLMRQMDNPRRFDLALRSVGSGGESLGAAILDWGHDAFGFTINEFYGQTECNPVLGCNANILPVRPGSTGKAIPGKHVGILGPDGSILPPGQAGEIAVRRGDPSMFLRYWNNPEKTAEKFIVAEDGHEYLLTGDEGETDADGYFWFASRTDDVITSSGYRIGPSEIEDCLNRHPAVAMSAVVGIPDPVRTEIVKAFVVLAGGHNGSPELADELKAHVRARLSPHVMPRLVDWIDQLPMTATGKIMRRDLRAKE